MANQQIRKEDEEFMAEKKAAFLGRSTLLANGILFTLFFLFVVGVIWAYIAQVDKITNGTGKVIPVSQVKIIQSLDGGLVAEIPVKEGQIVKKNQMVIRLDDTRYKADFQETYAKYLILLAVTARLKAEAYQDHAIRFPAILNKLQPELVERESRLFETRRSTLKAEVELLQHSLDLAKEEVKMYEPLVKKGIVAKVDLLRAQRSANEIQNKILEKQDDFREQAWTEFNNQNAQLEITAEQIKVLRDKMDRTVLYSPVYGIIKKLNVVTIGGVVTPGLNIMEIVPLEDSLLVEAEIRPQDIAFVQVGQPATVRITAYDYTIYGSLKGRVIYISPDAIEETHPATAESHIFYRVNIRTDRNYLGNEKHKLPIMPGMTATVQIMTGKQRVLDYLLKPLLKAKEEALRER